MTSKLVTKALAFSVLLLLVFVAYQTQTVKAVEYTVPYLEDFEEPTFDPYWIEEGHTSAEFNLSTAQARDTQSLSAHGVFYEEIIMSNIEDISFENDFYLSYWLYFSSNFSSIIDTDIFVNVGKSTDQNPYVGLNVDVWEGITYINVDYNYWYDNEWLYESGDIAEVNITLGEWHHLEAYGYNFTINGSLEAYLDDELVISYDDMQEINNPGYDFNMIDINMDLNPIDEESDVYIDDIQLGLIEPEPSPTPTTTPTSTPTTAPRHGGSFPSPTASVQTYSVYVTVLYKGEPLYSQLVCLTPNGVWSEYDYTNTTGQVVFSDIQPCTFTLTSDWQNFRYDATHQLVDRDLYLTVEFMPTEQPTENGGWWFPWWIIVLLVITAMIAMYLYYRHRKRHRKR